jgi:colanic acid/amylovoran biosynthesis glycosyltransferase
MRGCSIFLFGSNCHPCRRLSKSPNVKKDCEVDLLRARADVELALVTEGPARTGIEARSRLRNLGGQVSLVGACNHDRVADYCRENDTFVLSSFPQGVPVVLMEAMAIEPSCVATWMTGIPEIIKRDVEGLLVPPASPAALADAIEGLMDDPDSARRLGAAGRQKILSKYHLGRNVERLAQEFRKRVAEGPRGSQMSKGISSIWRQ